MSSFKQGFYSPKNPQKYKGNPSQIVYRSSLELKFMLYLDQHPDVIRWASEEGYIVVPYTSPIDNRTHRYFPDFWFERKDKNGNIKCFLVEVKPLEQTKPPKKKLNKDGKPDKYYMKKAMTYAVNIAKWSAAKDICKQRNWTFKIITDKDIK